MRVLVHDFAGHPFQVDLSRELARRGHVTLHAYCSSVTTGRGSVTRQRDDPSPFSVCPIDLGRAFDRYSPLRRPVDETHYGLRLGRLVRSWRPELVLSGNTPLISQALLLSSVRSAGALLVYWLQDFLGVGTRSTLARAAPLVGDVLGAAIARLERYTLRHSDAVVAITADFSTAVRATGVPEHRLSVIENWAPIAELPIRPRHNDWSAAHGLDDGPVLLYSGTLGLKHDPGVLLDLARQLAAGGSGKVVVVSEGLGAAWLEDQIAASALTNLTVLPYQPYEALPDVLGSADILVCLLEASAGVFSVPSKVLTYLCAGRPILGVIPHDNLAARLVRDCGAGLVTEPGDRAAVLAAAERLSVDAALRAAMGARARAHAERSFDISTIANRFDEVFAVAARAAESEAERTAQLGRSSLELS